jgi:hypothetical protein
MLQTPAKRVLVVGGGDGGVLRELARHASLEVRLSPGERGGEGGVWAYLLGGGGRGGAGGD